MQVRQQMDLDQHQENAHHPIKPIQNSKPLNKRSNRAFGQDLTNQHRQFSNQINQQNNKSHHPSKLNRSDPPQDGFNFIKKPIVLQINQQNNKSHHPSKLNRSDPPQDGFNFIKK
eukprot:121325_1